MPLSGSWGTVPITGIWSDRNGQPVTGSVDFIANYAVSVDGVLVVPTKITALVNDGTLATTLPVTASPGTQTYIVHERMGIYTRPQFVITVVYGSPGIDITDGTVGGGTYH